MRTMTMLTTSVLPGEYTHEVLDHTPHYPLGLDSQSVHRVFVSLTNTTQVSHTHHFGEIDKTGAGACQTCGATAWSPGWVGRGVYCSETATWIGQRMGDLALAVEYDRSEVALILVQSELGAVTVAAEFDGSDQASTRTGIPVPRMAYLALGGNVESGR